MASSRHRRRNDPRAVPNATTPAVGPADPATGPQVRSKISGKQIAAQPFPGLGDRAGGRHRPRGVPAVPPVQRPGDLGRDLCVVILGKQTQRQRQIRDHMRGQLAVRALLAHPAHRDRLIDRIPRHRVDQHPQRHLIRTHIRTNRHNLAMTDDHHTAQITATRHAEPTKSQHQQHDQLRLRGIGLGPTCTAAPTSAVAAMPRRPRSDYCCSDPTRCSLRRCAVGRDSCRSRQTILPYVENARVSYSPLHVTRNVEISKCRRPITELRQPSSDLTRLG